MIRAIIQVSALGITLVSAIILAKGYIRLSSKDIAELQIARAGYHEGLIKSMSAQYANTLIGIILLCVAFFLQVVNSFWSMRWKDFEVSWVGGLVALTISVLVLFVSWKGADKLADHMKNEVDRILLHPEATASSEDVS